MRTSFVVFLCSAVTWVLVGPPRMAAQEPPAEKKEQKGEGKTEPFYEGKSLSEWLNVLKDKESENRGDAALALAKMGRESRPAAPSLVVLLRDEKDGYGRRLAAYVLAYTRPISDVAPHLVRALKDRDSVVRRQAATALANMGPGARSVTKELVAELKNSNSDVRQLAAYVLGNIDPEPNDVVPALSAAVKDKAETVRKAAFEALQKIDPAAAARVGS